MQPYHHTYIIASSWQNARLHAAFFFEINGIAQCVFSEFFGIFSKELSGRDCATMSGNRIEQKTIQKLVFE